MPCTYDIEVDTHIVHILFVGTVTVADRLAMYARIGADPRVDRDALVRMLIDQRKMDNEPTFEDLESILEYGGTQRAEQSRSVRAAIVVTRTVLFGMGRMLATRSEHLANVRPFYDVDEAREWLLS